MKIKYIFFVNYVVAVLAVIFSLLQDGNASSLLMLIGFPQWIAFVVMLGYLHMKNVLKAAGHIEDLRDSISFIFGIITPVLFFVVSIPLSLALDVSPDCSFLFRVSLFFGVLSGLMALYLAGVVIYITYPIQVKFNAGIYKKIID